jgi:hypothetical protein
MDESTKPQKLNAAGFSTIPIELHREISELDPHVYEIYPLLSKNTASTRFSSKLEKHGKWLR